MQQIIVDSPGVCLCYTGIQYRIVWSWNAQKRSEKRTASKRRVSQKLCIAHIHYSHKLVAHRAWLPLYKYCIPYVCRFTPTQLISKLTEKGLPQIGLVIDLTNTQNPTKYYDPQVWNTRHIRSYIYTCIPFIVCVKGIQAKRNWTSQAPIRRSRTTFRRCLQTVSSGFWNYVLNGK